MHVQQSTISEYLYLSADETWFHTRSNLVHLVLDTHCYNIICKSQKMKKYSGMSSCLIGDPINSNIGDLSDMLDQACWSPIRHVGLSLGMSFSNQACQAPMGLQSDILISNRSLMGLQYVSDNDNINVNSIKFNLGNGMSRCLPLGHL